MTTSEIMESRKKGRIFFRNDEEFFHLHKRWFLGEEPSLVSAVVRVLQTVIVTVVRDTIEEEKKPEDVARTFKQDSTRRPQSGRATELRREIKQKVEGRLQCTFALIEAIVAECALGLVEAFEIGADCVEQEGDGLEDTGIDIRPVSMKIDDTVDPEENAFVDLVACEAPLRRGRTF